MISQTLGKYEIQGEIGEGGMGKVYKAWHPVLGKAVAIKVPQPEKCNDREFVEAFVREARLAARLDHPNIVKISDVDEHNGIPYIVMEYVPGLDLRKMIQEFGWLPPEKVCTLFDQIAEALDYAHAQGIIHCDVKPSNVLVDTDGRVKLVDFGIARARARVKRSQEEPKRSVGSPWYMSPEHVQGKELDGYSDIYSLGIVLYQMLTGKVPFERGSSREIKEAHLTQLPPPPSKKRPGLPRGVDSVVLRALAKEPEKRYASASQMARDLRAALFPTSRWPLVLLAVAIIVLVLLVISYFLPSCNSSLPISMLVHMRTPSATVLEAAHPTLTAIIRVLTLTPTMSVTRVRTAFATAAQATQTTVAKATQTAVLQATQTAIAKQTSTAAAKATSTAIAMHTATAQAAVVQPTSTRTPSPYKYPAPPLSTPAKDATFTGYVTMEFSWQPVAPQLAADEYYALVITFLHRDGHRYPYLQATTKSTRWQGQLNPFLYDSDVLADRGLGWQHGWYVVVMRNPGMNDKGQITGSAVSPRSEERLFTWKLEAGAPAPGPRPTPTRTPKI
nr:serine/threonine protein kinase [Chloroflexota bacterium]